MNILYILVPSPISRCIAGKYFLLFCGLKSENLIFNSVFMMFYKLNNTYLDPYLMKLDLFKAEN